MRNRIARWLPVVVLGVLVCACAALEQPAGDEPGGEEMPADAEVVGEDGTADLDPEPADGGGAPDRDPAGGDGRVCGGIQGLPCPEGWFCDLPAGECRGADLQGVCVEQPEVCTQQYTPVCGCDGKTYGNDCERRAAGIQKDHDGACG